MQWGLDQTHRVTVPLTVMLFPVSYAALPWCARSGRERIETPIPRARTIRNLLFKSHLLFAGTGPTSLGWVRPHLSKLDAILKRGLATVKCSSTGHASRALSEMMSRYTSISLHRAFSGIT